MDSGVPSALAWAPYCGSGPTPSEIMGRWNGDPWLLALLAVGVGAWLIHRRGGGGRDGFVMAAFAILALAFVSPFCALTSALFSARVAHHAALVSIIAPLLAFGLPARTVPAPSLPLATLLHAVVFWAWHAPDAYGWALSSDLGYWIMQVSLLGSALGFWASVRSAGGLAAAGALLATMMQMGLLGALITFAASPLYAPHLTTTWPWGLSPLADQQLAGLIMWAPMAGAYLLAALVLVARALDAGRAEASPA